MYKAPEYDRNNKLLFFLRRNLHTRAFSKRSDHDEMAKEREQKIGVLKREFARKYGPRCK
jgi:hypothetical protein